MNLIGLDIDGVFNSHGWYGTAEYARKEASARTDFDYRVAELDPRCVRRLDTIIEENNAYVLITSSWRTAGVDTIQGYFKAAGLRHNNRIIGCLPYALPGSWVTYNADYGKSNFIRGLEAEVWILANMWEPAVVRVVFIDDDSDFGRLKDLCWVRTTLFSGPDTLDPAKYNYTGPYNGLQDDHIRQVREKFKAQANNPAGNIILNEPHPNLTEVGRKALYGG